MWSSTYEGLVCFKWIETKSGFRRRSAYMNRGAGVWVGAHVDPLVVFVGVVSEPVWG